MAGSSGPVVCLVQTQAAIMNCNHVRPCPVLAQIAHAAVLGVLASTAAALLSGRPTTTCMHSPQSAWNADPAAWARPAARNLNAHLSMQEAPAGLACLQGQAGPLMQIVSALQAYGMSGGRALSAAQTGVPPSKGGAAPAQQAPGPGQACLPWAASPCLRGTW